MSYPVESKGGLKQYDVEKKKNSACFGRGAQRGLEAKWGRGWGAKKEDHLGRSVVINSTGPKSQTNGVTDSQVRIRGQQSAPRPPGMRTDRKNPLDGGSP